MTHYTPLHRPWFDDWNGCGLLFGEGWPTGYLMKKVGVLDRVLDSVNIAMIKVVFFFFYFFFLFCLFPFGTRYHSVVFRRT